MWAVFPVSRIRYNFDGCFIVFYLFIPFLNTLIRHLSERLHVKLVLLCSFIYIVFGTIHIGTFGVIMNYVSWFIVLYFIASYIRLYPKAWFSNNKICGLLLIIFILLSAISVVVCAWIGTKSGIFIPYYFVTDTNTFLVVMVGVFAFLFFKNLKIPYNKCINTVAALTFGILLIHANSETMRQWLWIDVLDNVGHYDDKLLPLYAIGCVIGIFAVCAVIDLIRIKLIENAFFKLWDKYWDRIANYYKMNEEKILHKLNIQ